MEIYIIQNITTNKIYKIISFGKYNTNVFTVCVCVSYELKGIINHMIFVLC